MNATNQTNTNKINNRNLKPGTRVINKNDGKAGLVIRTCTRRRNGTAWSYLVDTSYGREVWEAGEVFVPAND